MVLGSNFTSQLAPGYESESVPVPNQVGSTNDWQFIEQSSGVYLMAINNDGKLWVNGRNSYGELGDGTTKK